MTLRVIATETLKSLTTTVDYSLQRGSEMMMGMRRRDVCQYLRRQWGEWYRRAVFCLRLGLVVLGARQREPFWQF